MTVLRVRKKETNFLILDKTCLNEQKLSWSAKGLHAYLMSLPQDWRINVNDLKNRATNGRDSVRGLLKELERVGYITREWVRDEQTGKYSCLEYIVSELPDPDNPETGFSGPVIPAPEKTTLISINNNKYTENKEIKAAVKTAYFTPSDSMTRKKAAAVFLDAKPKGTEKITPGPISNYQSSPEDLVIRETLTPHQQEKIHSFTQTLSRDGFIVTQKEIEYCMLSCEHFKGSGQDFYRKLNAIRIVISRGEWQTPAGMILDAKEKLNSNFLSLQARCRDAKAEVNHFQGLLKTANEAVRANIETILIGAYKKLNELERHLRDASAGDSY